MKNQDLDEIIDTARQEHRIPPAVPKDKLWARIDAAREPHRAASRVVRPTFGRAVSWCAAVAAVLVLGVALGRWSEQFENGTPESSPIAVAQGRVVNGSAVYDRMAVTMLDRADALLTDFRTQSCQGDAQSTRLATWA